MITSFKAWIAANVGKTIYIPGYKTAECVAPFWLFNAAHKGESYAAAGACNLWTAANGLPYIWDSYDRIVTGFKYADWVIWSGSYGEYPNGGSGHVALFLRHSRPGYAIFLSQNPGAFREMELSLNGVLGALRAKGVPAAPAIPPAPPKPAPKPSTPAPVNRRVTSTVANVRVGAGTSHGLAPGLAGGLAKGSLVGVIGYTETKTPPYPGTTRVWYKTKSGFWMWAGNMELNIKGLVRL